MLTIITPVYCTSKDDYLFERVVWFIKNSFTSNSIKRILVDYASPDYIAQEFRDLCKEKDILYVELKKYGELFSAGECRNIGVSMASTEYITFQDVDLYAPDSIYSKILTKIANMEFYNDLEIVPCLYLSEEFSSLFFDQVEEINQDNLDDLFSKAYSYYLASDNNIHMYAPVTSTLLVKRKFFMESGGNNLSFQGHGYEDFESLHRLATLSNKFIKPVDYYSHDYKYHSAEYKGYRTFFSLFGRQLMNESIFFVHLWHPKNINASYVNKNHVNRELFNKLVREFDTKDKQPEALTELYSRDKTLILAPRFGKTVETIRVALPYLGNVVFAQDKDFSDVESFDHFLNANGINRVLFFNSYGNDFRYQLYLWCLEQKIHTINFDRGALPESWFFDSKGFNYASESYAINKWDRELTIEEEREVAEYINMTLIGDNELESNGDRIGSYAFRRKYNINTEKVLFIPLQRPNDSVIRYFAGSALSVPNFIDQIDALAENLSQDNWIICIKQHPLEPVSSHQFTSTNIRILNEKDHFKDAITICDAVFLINSGVGLYSLMFNKPTFNIGKAFYSHEGLSTQVESFGELYANLCSIKTKVCNPDVSKVHRFVNYLIKDFYSFGVTKYSIEQQKNTSLTRVARYIDFTTLRLPSITSDIFTTINIIRRTNALPITSPYYDYYHSWFGLRNRINAMANDTNEVKNIQKELVSTKEKIKQLQFRQTSEISTQYIPKISKNSFKRKACKLVKSPGKFFKDAYTNFFSKKGK